jgi:signal transduction histidine kinase
VIRGSSRIEGPAAQRLAWWVGLASIAMMLGALGLMFVDRHVTLPREANGWSLPNVLDVTVNIGVPVIGIVMATRRPDNRIGWLFLVAGFFLGLSNLGGAYAAHALVASAPPLPFGRIAAWLANVAGLIPIGILALLFLIFPTGHLPSPRWRPVGWVLGVAIATLTTLSMVVATLAWSDPFAETGPTLGRVAILFFVAFYLLLFVMVASVVSLGIRYAHSKGEERLQLKWFVFAAVPVAIAFAATATTNSPLGSLVFTLTLLFLYAAIGIAIVRYRLYEIDVVISKAVAFGSLVVFITVVYVGVVVGIGAIVGSGRSPLLSALAAGIVAVAFQPVRQWARKLANRVVYGKRATPYEVLSEFSERIAGTYSTEDVLPRMAELLAAGTGAERTAVWLRLGGELRVEAWSGPSPEVTTLRVTDGEVPPMPRGEMAVPVRHAGDLLGAISVRMPTTEPLGPEQDRLIADVASQAGLVLSNVRLIEELRASRQRLVAAQDAERRKLERDLHDGAQQQFVSVGIKARLAESMVGRDEHAVRDTLRQVVDETQAALENLRDLAHGIYPPVLADQGLGAALTSQGRKSPFPVDVTVDAAGRFAQEVEAAVYFCCLECLQNIAKYAGASRAWVRVWPDADMLAFTVRDDGGGFDVSRTPRGAGTQNMADRLAALGGRLDVRSVPGGGTTVSGSVPVGS